MIVDEAHHAPAAGWERSMKQWPGQVVVMTATPWRLTKKEGFDHLFDKLICGPPVADLQFNGHLCSAKAKAPPLEHRILGGTPGSAGECKPGRIERAISELLCIEGPLQSRVGGQLCSVDRLHRQVHQPNRHSSPHRTLEKLSHAPPVSLVEPPQGVVVRVLPTGQPQVRYLVTTGSFQLAAGAHVGHESVKPHAQQCSRMVDRRSQWVPFNVHAKLGPLLPIQGVGLSSKRFHPNGREPGDYEDGQEAWFTARIASLIG